VENIKDKREMIRTIESFGERYYDRYLLRWDKNVLETNWWEALKFFLSHSFMRGRRDELSNEYYHFTLDVLKRRFVESGESELAAGSEELERSSPLFNKQVILDFKSRHKLGRKNSLRDRSFELEVLQINNLVKELATPRKVLVNWDEGSYEKKIHLGNDEDIMMVLDVLSFIADQDRRNIYHWIIETIKERGIKAAYDDLTKIRAIKDKLASFIIRDVLLLNPGLNKGDYKYVFPIDTWVRRIAMKLGCKDERPSGIRNFFLKQCAGDQPSALRINAGLWFLGFHSLEILLDNLEKL